MDRLLSFTPEHDLFREQVRRWLDKEVVPYHDQWERDGLVPREIWRSAGEQGLLCPWLPEEYGGVGADFLYSVVIIEELSRAQASGLGFPVHSDITAHYIYKYGSEELRREILPKCASGEIVLAIAMTEPNTGSDLAAVRTTALADGADDYVVNGQKTFITNGQHCDLVVVVAKTNTEIQPPHAGISLLLVESDRAGFARGRNLEKVGLHAQDTSELSFADCHVPRSNLLGDGEGQGFVQLATELARERLVVALIAQAEAEKALELALAYAREREAFGKPIGRFQHNAFKLAEMATKIAVGRSFVDHLVLEHMAGKNLVGEASMAKCWVTDMLCQVVDDAVQLHGGYGYMLEYPIGKMYQNARVHRIFAGSNEVMKLIISRQLGL